MPNQLQININAIPTGFDIDYLLQLAMEQQIFISDPEPIEIPAFNCSLKYLTSLPFEIWAELIEIENNTPNA